MYTNIMITEVGFLYNYRVFVTLDFTLYIYFI